MDLPRLHGGEALQARGSGEGNNGRQERLREGDLVFYTESMAWVHGATCRTRLEGVGGISGRRCALSLGVWMAVSVALWCSRNGRGFSEGADRMACG
jgi:hypothetical protein